MGRFVSMMIKLHATKRLGVIALIVSGTLGVVPMATGQSSTPTQLDLQRQTRSVDFSGATYTKPFRTGTVLPAVCSLGEAYFLTTAGPGSNLYFCTSPNTWSAQAGTVQQSSGGGTMNLTTSGSQLTVGSNCTISTPCNLRIGVNVYSFSSAATATLLSGTGTAFLYLSSAGVLTVGHNMNLTCAGGCTAQSSVSSFPPDSLPIASWNASSGTWTSGTNLQTSGSRDLTSIGSGLLSVNVGGATKISTDPTVVGLRTSVPSSASSACSSGAWAADTSYYYICVGTNTWKRTSLVSW